MFHMLTKRKEHITHIINALICLSFLSGVLLTSACKDDEEHLEPLPYQVLDSIISTNVISFDEAVQFGKDRYGLTDEQIEPYRRQINMASMRTRLYNAHVITYHTTDPNGLPIVISGVVYYPKSGKPRGVVEAVSFNSNKQECPSRNLANAELLTGMAGYIVLVSDLIGCGVSESKLFPYFYHNCIAKMLADLRLAATELVRNEYGRSMPNWTLISGFSLSASEAWALARYYHFHPELGVEPNQIWISSGPYYPLEILKYQLNTQYTDNAYIPGAICSTNYYDNLGLDLQEIFRGQLKEHYEEWCMGDLTLLELCNRLGPDITQYLNMDFFNEENNDYQRLLASIERFNIPNDWVPSCPVHVYHGTEDTFVPIFSSDKLVEYLRSVGAEVEYVVTDNGHIENGIDMALDMAEYLYK